MSQDLSSPCTDCGIETLSVDHRRAECYDVTEEVWAASGMPFEGYLCIGCQTRMPQVLVDHFGPTNCSISAWSQITEAPHGAADRSPEESRGDQIALTRV